MSEQTPGTEHVVQLSGGASSMAAALRVATKYGTDCLRLVFTDTLIEDEDLYRFLLEGAGRIFGRDMSFLARQAADLPTVESGDLAHRKSRLASIRSAATALLPGLIWLADGRTPWEVFEDERYIGNTRADPCSKILKRQMSDRWRGDHCDPTRTVVYFGFNFDETNRWARAACAIGDDWRIDFPLAWSPTCWNPAAECEAAGLTLPRLYALGFRHNNCGGFCCKAGQKQFQHLLNVLPDRYRYHEGQEEAMRAFLRKDESILRDRRKARTSRTLPLKQFRQRLQRHPEFFDPSDIGECSCFAPSSPEAPPAAVAGSGEGEGA